MKIAFFPKLAADGIRKNKRMYVPYILMGSLMVMMHYILDFLTENPTLKQMKGGTSITMALQLGTWVIAFFSLLFLFYTNSFLIRRRNREFGLYNILGMGKGGICRIIIWENLLVGVVATTIGLIFGVVLSKIAELCLINLLHIEVSYELRIGFASLGKTAAIYAGIYLLLLISAAIRVFRLRPVELLKSDRVGEKPPKGNWFFTIIGLICLGIAYYLAVSIEEPLAAFTVFFLAVLLVILATYLLFISGSVVYCRLLQKNKKYYYKSNHFVSVASMAYRMKRNGAGLASICILLTMVLVMISSTSSLYLGAEDSIRNRYPDDVNILVTFDGIEGLAEENMKSLRECVNKENGNKEAGSDYCLAQIIGLFTEDGMIVDVDAVENFSLDTYDDVGALAILALDDYNRMTGGEERLEENECFLFFDRVDYTSETFALPEGKAYRVKKSEKECPMSGELKAMIIPTMCIVVEDMEAFVEPVMDMVDSLGNPMMQFNWQYGFAMDSSKKEMEMADALQEVLRNPDLEKSYHIATCSVESREANRASFYEMYGSLFFLGIMLSIVFLTAAVLIIYYKQISEGYEDESRFEIMQKVGMTKKDIRKSVNSQMLTVFFLPLIFAGIHLAFAFPLLWKLLMLFNLNNRTLIIVITAISYGIFALFYAVVYKLTSNAYYAIVSGKKE